MEQACCMQLDTVAPASHCFELKRSGTRLLHANAHLDAWLTLFGVKTNWNKLVACGWAKLRVVGILRS